jgi:hypothetical protein
MGLISLLFPIFLALILIVVLFGIIYLIKRREGEIKDEMKSLREKLNDIEYIDEVLDTEIIEETIGEILEEEETFNFPCLIPPYSNGSCDPGYKIETGEDTGKKCCYPEDSIKPSEFQRKLKLANQIIQEILITMVMGELLERLVKKLLTLGITRTGGKGAISAAARAAKAARAARKAALASKAVATSIRTAVRTGSRALVKAVTGGPIGAAFLIVDVIGMVLDIQDTLGYASWIPQATFVSTKNNIDYQFGKAMEQADMEFPILYPLNELYGESYSTAMELAYAKLIDKYFVSDMELEKNSEYKKAFDDFVDALVDSIVNETSEPELPKTIEEYAIEITKDRHNERDELIYEEMKNLIPLGDLVSNTQMYPKISSPTTIGISLSQEGARKLNEKNKPKWLNDEYTKLAAVYTDKYYIYESGEADDLTMKEMTLAEKTVLATGYGALFSMCEKRRKLKSSSAPITPTSYGSYFDFENAKCVFTKQLCDRYGMDWKSDKNDCEIGESQKYLEMLFGTSIVRHIKDVASERDEDFESGDINRIAAATFSTIVDPYGLMDRGEDGQTLFGDDVDDTIEYVAGEVYEYAIEKNPLWIGNWGLW